VNRISITGGHAARASALLLVALLPAFGCGERDGAGRDARELADAEFDRGPHGGRLLTNGSFALELTTYERGVPPEMRVWVFDDGAPRPVSDVALDVTLRRLGGRVERIQFAPRGDYLVGERKVAEPHSFDVEVLAREGGREHRFAFESYEGRVELDAEQRAAAGIEIARAKPATIRERIALNGRIAANEETLAHVVPRFPGVVRSVHKQLGDPVASGALLAVIESNESLHPYQIRASLPGTVIAKDLAPGEFVASDRTVFIVADLSTVWLDLDVYRPDVGRLQVGQPVTIVGGDGTPPGETAISYLSPVGVPETQTFLARALLPNPDGRWRPGLYVTAEVEVATVDVPVAVSASAVQRLRDRDVVFVSEGDLVEAQPVELGRRDADRVELRAGLAAGQRYVAEGSFLLKAEVGKAGASHEH
jgi:cobalt-zinc-cadmium efflux system membrane fusion protein